MLGTYLRVAGRNLRQGGRRTWLLGGAITLVTLLLVLLAALSAGLESTMIRAATTLSSGHVNVGGFYKVTSGQAIPVIREAEQLKAFVRAHVEGVDLVIDRARGWGKVISEKASLMAGLSGVDIDAERRLHEVLEVVDGDLDGLREPDTVVLFEGQAERLEAGVGDPLTLTAETEAGVNNTLDLRVVAVVRDVGFLSAWNLFVPRATVQRIYQLREDTSGAVQVYLDDPDRAAEVRATLHEALVDAGRPVMDHDPQPFFMKFERVAGEDWTGEKLDLTTWKDEVSYLLWILTGFATLRWLLLVGLMVVVGIGIMNAGWMAIRERTAEIGTLRAIGMSRGGVLSMVLLESVLLGVVATTLGATLGTLLALGIDAAGLRVPLEAFQYVLMSERLHLEPAAVDALVSVLSVTALTTLAALYPAWRAARLRPVTAMHHVG